MKKDDYQGKDDARTLMRAQEIMSDAKRHGSAKGHLKDLHKDQSREALHAKAAQGLRKAFPDDATAGQTKTSNSRKAAKANKPPARKSLGKTPQGGSPMKGGKTETVIQVRKVPNLKNANSGGY